jgi:hypothetical protein
LFLQGTSDKLAETKLIEPVVRKLGRGLRCISSEAADHSFHVPVRSGRNDHRSPDEILDAFAGWIGGIGAGEAVS